MTFPITETKAEVQARANASRRRWALANKPWLKSTGPKTPEGKARVARNAVLHNYYGTEARQARALLAQICRELGVE